MILIAGRGAFALRPMLEADARWGRNEGIRQTVPGPTPRRMPAEVALMVWTGDGNNRFATSLMTLLKELEATFPDMAWQTNSQTGTIGNPDHQSQGSASDHNPWLNKTVRALDVASPDEVSNGPDCESLFNLVNQMYAAQDPRVFPDGYAIYKRRITDWDRPGQFHDYDGDDPHVRHLHISVSTDPAGYDSTKKWLSGAEHTDADHHDELEEEEMGAYTVTQTVNPQTGNKRWFLTGPAGVKEVQESDANAAASFLGLKIVQASEAALAACRDDINAAASGK